MDVNPLGSQTLLGGDKLCNEVRWIHAIHMDLRFLFPENRTARFVVRRHARKLEYWSATTPEWVLDLRWAPLDGLPGMFCELLIEESLGKYPGVRHTFAVGPPRQAGRPPVVWGLHAAPLGEPLSPASVELIRLRWLVVTERYYGG